MELLLFLQLLSCCVNAACLALINSGISMRYTLAAVSCIINSNDEIVIDANYIQSNVSIQDS